MDFINETNESSVTLKSIFISYGKTEALRGVSFHAPQGEITALFGPSGAGKTTCLRLIAGLEKPSAGTIHIGTRLVSAENVWIPPRRRGVGFCFQEPALWPALRVREHVELPMRENGLHADERRKQAAALLDRFSLLPLAERKPEQLSGGEQKRLAFARTLANDPKILLLDEPLSSVEGPLRDELIDLIHSCKRNGTVILIVTHQLDEAFALADHLAILQEGRLLREGATQEVFLNPQSIAAAKLLGYRNFFPVHAKEDGIHSPFGMWVCAEKRQGEGLAAALPGDFIVERCEEGEGVVQACWFSGRGYRIRAAMGDRLVEGISSTTLPVGERVKVRLQGAPIWLEGKE
ncbi:MAG: ABC transporter ATP-binding protein [Candidatus Omnitrophota bacterium]